MTLQLSSFSSNQYPVKPMTLMNSKPINKEQTGKVTTTNDIQWDGKINSTTTTIYESMHNGIIIVFDPTYFLSSLVPIIFLMFPMLTW
jgi:hypothetical protein